jgi:hypothetical protein
VEADDDALDDVFEIKQLSIDVGGSLMSGEDIDRRLQQLTNEMSPGVEREADKGTH